MIIRRSKISRKSRKVARKSRKVARKSRNISRKSRKVNRKSRKVARKSRKVVRKSRRSLRKSRKSRSIGGSDGINTNPLSFKVNDLAELIPEEVLSVEEVLLKSHENEDDEEKQLSNGGTYVGEIEDGKPSGHGIYKKENLSSNNFNNINCSYKGSFVNGKFEGIGTFTATHSGYSYIYFGNFKDGKFDGDGVWKVFEDNLLRKAHEGKWIKGVMQEKTNNTM